MDEDFVLTWWGEHKEGALDEKNRANIDHGSCLDVAFFSGAPEEVLLILLRDDPDAVKRKSPNDYDTTLIYDVLESTPFSDEVALAVLQADLTAAQEIYDGETLLEVVIRKCCSMAVVTTVHDAYPKAIERMMPSVSFYEGKPRCNNMSGTGTGRTAISCYMYTKLELQQSCNKSLRAHEKGHRYFKWLHDSDELEQFLISKQTNKDRSQLFYSCDAYLSLGRELNPDTFKAFFRPHVSEAWVKETDGYGFTLL